VIAPRQQHDGFDVRLTGPRGVARLEPHAGRKPRRNAVLRLPHEARIGRLGEQCVDELIAADLGSAFAPSGRGRPMKDWIAMPRTPDAWNDLASEATAYLET